MSLHDEQRNTELQEAKLTITAQGDVIKDLNEGVLTATAAITSLKAELAGLQQIEAHRDHLDTELTKANATITEADRLHEVKSELVIELIDMLATHEPEVAQRIRTAFNREEKS